MEPEGHSNCSAVYFTLVYDYGVKRWVWFCSETLQKWDVARAEVQAHLLTAWLQSPFCSCQSAFSFEDILITILLNPSLQLNLSLFPSDEAVVLWKGSKRIHCIETSLSWPKRVCLCCVTRGNRLLVHLPDSSWLAVSQALTPVCGCV